MKEKEAKSQSQDKVGSDQEEDSQEDDGAGPEPPVQPLDEIPDMPADVEGLTNLYEDGEGVFLSVVPTLQQMSRGASTANLVVGAEIPYPVNLGNYSTNYFTVNGRVAYCLESTKATPPASDYVANEFESNGLLQKVLYYGYGGPGDVTNIYMPAFDAQLKYLFTHLAAAYAYCGIDGFAGCTMADIEECGVWGYVSYLNNLEAPPSAWLNVSPIHPDAYAQGDIQRTPELRLQGDHRCSVIISLPEGVTCHYNGADVKDSVEVFGGTSFYFTAPWTMRGIWDTGDMPNQLGSQWKTMVLSTGGGNQDIGYGAFFEDENYQIRIRVTWKEMSQVKVIKKDEATGVELSGAVYGIYSDPGCTNSIMEMPETDANGISQAIIPKTQDIVYVKEISAPQGYIRNPQVYDVQLTAAKTATITVTDKEQKGKLTVQKQGEALNGVINEEGTLRFNYEYVPYAGAKYTIYATEDIYSQDQVTKFHNAGEIVAQLETGLDGNALSDELPLGKYKVVEQQAPHGLVLGKTEEQTSKEVSLAYAGQEAELSQSTVAFTNDRPEVLVKAVKKSENGGITLAGAVFGLYADSDITDHTGAFLVAKGTLIEQAVSDGDGNANFQSDIPIGFQYSVKEIQAPENYYKSDENFTFTYGYKDDRTYAYTFEQDFQNEEVRGEIQIQKTDRDSRGFISQGDAQLVGAAYGLYAAADIEAPDKKSGIIYRKGELVDQGKISEAGTLEFTDLYLGEYVIKETEPPKGYLLDAAEYPVSLAYGGQDVNTVRKNVTVEENVKKQAFQVLKISEDGEQTETALVEGAGFKIFLISSLTGVQDGKLQPENGSTFSPEDFIDYDFSGDETASYYADGEKVIVPELFTDHTGYLKSPELPYGDYVVVESTVPDNLNRVNPFIVHISEDSREPQAWRVLDDRPFQFLLKITKKDAQTQADVVDNSASYKIYNVDAEEYVEMAVRYPNKEKVSVFRTNEEGFLITPGLLKSGTYRIEEVHAPEDYVQQGFESILISDGRDVPLNEVTNGGGYQEAGAGDVLISVDSDTAHQIEEESGTYTVLVEQSNNEAVGSLTLHKKGEKLKGASNVQAQFLNKIKNGMASVVNQISGFFTGEDVMKETFGYIFSYEETGLEGAKFSVYAGETIYTSDGQTDSDGNRTVRYGKDALVASIVTDGEGTAVLNNLPIGDYYVVEEKTGENHVLDREKRNFAITYNGQETSVDYVEMNLTNERQRISLEILKKDSVTGAPIEGVSFGLYAGEEILNAEGQSVMAKDILIETGKTDEAGKLVFQSDLPHGRYYTRELEKQAGYLDSEEIYIFDASYTNPMEKVLHLSCEVVNDPTVTEFIKTDLTGGQEVEGAKLQILKDGKVVEEWLSGKEPHTVYALEPGEYLLHEEQAPTEQGYVWAEDVIFTVEETGEIQKVEMEDDHTKVTVIKTDITDGKEISGAKMQIINGDGEIVEEWVSGKEHLIEYLPTGTYTLHEEAAVDGYVVADDMEFTVQETGEIQTVEMQDERARGKLMIHKTDSESGEALEDVEFTLYEKESGEEAAALVTDKDGNAESELLPIGKYEDGAFQEDIVYVLKETKPKEGYQEPGEEWEIIFEYQDDQTPVIEVLKEIQNTKDPDTVTDTGTSGKIPKTGDHINWIFPLLGVLIGGGSLLWVTVRMKRTRKRRRFQKRSGRRRTERR